MIYNVVKLKHRSWSYNAKKFKLKETNYKHVIDVIACDDV